MQAVLESVRTHVSPRKGITNVMLDSMARGMNLKLYRGLFNARELATEKTDFDHSSRFTIIINVGRHFVCVHNCGDKLLYLDSYGVSCLNPLVCDYLLQHFGKKTPIYYNKLAIQTLDSTFCGLYCLLFALYLDKRSNQSKVCLRFTKEPSRRNDRLCMQYMKCLMTE